MRLLSGSDDDRSSLDVGIHSTVRALKDADGDLINAIMVGLYRFPRRHDDHTNPGVNRMPRDQTTSYLALPQNSTCAQECSV